MSITNIFDTAMANVSFSLSFSRPLSLFLYLLTYMQYHVRMTEREMYGVN